MNAKGSESTRDAVLRFVRSELAYDDADVGESTDLIGAGVIDSMSLLRLVSFLEERFGIEVDDESLVPDNFRSIESIESYVRSARAAAEPGRAEAGA